MNHTPKVLRQRFTVWKGAKAAVVLAYEDMATLQNQITRNIECCALTEYNHKQGGRMKCCKCADGSYPWCDKPELDIVYIDQVSGEGYCVFHAPRGKKGVSDEQFRTLFFNRIKKWQHEIESRKNPSYGAQHDYLARFNGAIIPCDLRFGLSLGNNRTIIDASFLDAEFHGDVDFSNCIFDGDTMLGTCFQNVKFFGKVRFSQVTFKNDVSFSNASFAKLADFSHSTFEGIASFSGIFFGDVFINHSHIKKRIQFYDFTFKKQANMADCDGKRGAIIIKNPFSIKTMQNIVFSKKDLRLFDYRACVWDDRLGLESSQNSNWLDCADLYRAMKQRASEEHDQPQVSRWHFREKLMQLKQLLNNERSNNLLEEVEDRDAKWSARIKAWFKLLALPPYLPKLTLTGLYWVTSGFGERAVRAGVWLAILIALPFFMHSTIATWLSSLLSSLWATIPYSPNINTFAASVRDSVNATAALESIPFTKDLNGPDGANGWLKVAQGLWQSAIALQFTLFALAVRNRFRR